MNFCEDCGAPLTPGVRFCENCGARISDADYASQNSVSNKDSTNNEKGIIYTNVELLSSRIGFMPEDILGMLDDIIDARKHDGIEYELFDISEKISDNDSIEEHISLIKEAVSNGQRYLFIIGGPDIIPACVWENRASDVEYDSDVSSDLPFATLDADSPFNGKKYDFDNLLYVGRLPDSAFMNYLGNITCYNTPSSVNAFSMSAMVWQMETMDTYSKVCEATGGYNNADMLTSPEYEVADVPDNLPAETNLLLFNLHGSNQAEFWYGQEGNNYPEAISPDSFNHIWVPYFLAVEACYGARYENLEPSESVLLSAMNNKCISFLGSSRIAFGTAEPEGTCADVICCEYLLNVLHGMRAGEAFNLARKKLMENVDPEVIKTLAEFSLYGDPTVKITANVEKSVLSATKTKERKIKGLIGTMPDIRNAVRLELVKVDEKITSVAEEFIQRYPWMKGAEAKYYRNTASTSGEINAVFTKKNAFGPQLVSITISRDGRIQKYKETK